MAVGPPDGIPEFDVSLHSFSAVRKEVGSRFNSARLKQQDDDRCPKFEKAFVFSLGDVFARLISLLNGADREGAYFRHEYVADILRMDLAKVSMISREVRNSSTSRIRRYGEISSG